MFTKEIMGMDLFQIISAFQVYCVLGWLVESIYMSICNKQITNRGFAKGPYCPIYGFGAVFGYMLLCPLSDNPLLLYFAGAFIATVFEYLVAAGMKRIFGTVWWDYNNKPFNYKGVICLESTVAWGFYAIFIIMFLHERILLTIDRYPLVFNKNIMMLLYFLMAVDYIFQVCRALNIDLKNKVIDKYQSIKARWY